MIVDCKEALFISRNTQELAEVIIRFKNLDAVYRGNLSLYLDSDFWEVFDVRRGMVLFRHSFKHVRQLCEDMRILTHDFANLGLVIHSISRGRKPNVSESVSIKHLYCIYGMDEYIFTNKYIKSYIYGKFEKKENLADNLVCY